MARGEAASVVVDAALAEHASMLNPLHSLGDIELPTFASSSSSEQPRSKEEQPEGRPAIPLWRAALTYAGSSPRTEAPLEATLKERVAYARRYPSHHARAVVALHFSILAWTGLWDLLTYCGLALVLPDDGRRNIVWVVLGLTAMVLLDVFHSNAGVPGDLGLGSFWENNPSLAKRWFRSLASFAAQVFLTCGAYNLLNDHSLDHTFARDLWYATSGLAVTSAVDAFLARAEMLGRARKPDHKSGWDLSFGGGTHRPGLGVALALGAYCGQVLTWVGFDNCLCYWPYSGVWRQGDNPDCFWGCVFGERRYYHQLPIMALGIALLFWSGGLLYFAGVADRFDKAAHPRVQASLPAPAGPLTSGALWAAFARSVLAQAGYYAHLTAFWYLVDEDVDASFDFDLAAASEDRNGAYLALGLAGLYACGTFWADAGGG